MRKKLVLMIGCTLFLFTAGCPKEFEALPKEDCPKIVAHGKAILGEGLKGKTDDELIGKCRSSTPKQRGCAMVATSGADIMKCSLVKD